MSRSPQHLLITYVFISSKGACPDVRALAAATLLPFGFGVPLCHIIIITITNIQHYSIILLFLLSFVMDNLPAKLFAFSEQRASSLRLFCSRLRFHHRLGSDDYHVPLQDSDNYHPVIV